MFTKDEMTSKVTDALVDYAGKNIVNYVDGQLRNNIQLYRLSRYSVSGVFSSNMRRIVMPDVQTTFHIFAFNVIHASWLYKQLEKYTGEKWITLQDLCNDYEINIDIYTENGVMIPKKMVHLSMRDSSSTRCGYIAIDARTTHSSIVETETMYLTIYMDTSIANTRKVYSYIPVLGSTVAELTNLIATYNQNVGVSTIYVDGHYYYQPSNSFLNTVTLRNKEVELIIDNNTELSFLVQTRNKYNSTTDNKLKDIIHIPKSFGYDKIRTLNLAHLYAFDRVSKKGVKLPFTMNSEYYQLTYNDLGVPSDIIDNAMTYLGTEDIVILCRFVDYQSVDNRVKYNNEWLPILQEACTDSQLIDIYAGRVPSLVGYIDGDTLEQSMFNKIANGGIDLEYGDDLLDKMVKGIGYFNIPSVLGNTTFEISTSIPFTISTISVDRNVLVDTGTNTFLGYIFVNGLKIPSYLCSFSADDTKCKITVDGGNYSVTAQDNVDVKILVGDVASHMRCQPSASQYVYEFSTKSFKERDMIDVYKVVDTSGLNVTDHHDEVIPVGYTKLTDTEKNNIIYEAEYDSTTEKATITFSTNSFGNSYIIVPIGYNQYYTNTFTLSTTGYETESIVIVPTTNTSGISSEVPFLAVGDYEVFLNGRRLNKGIDYQLVSKKVTYSDTDLGTYITIQNKDYLKLNGTNIVDVVVKGYNVLDSTTGFVVDKKFGGGDDVNNLWFTGNTTVYLDGKFVRNDNITYAYDDVFVVSGDISVPNVTGYSVQTSVPEVLDEVLDPYVDDTDFERANAVLAYLLELHPYVEPETELIITQYRTVYSSFLNQVILHILTDDNIGTSYSYTDEDILNLITQFEYLKQYDVIFNDGFLKELPIMRRFYNLRPVYIEVHPTLVTDLRGISSDISATKLVLIRALIDRIFIEYLSV